MDVPLEAQNQHFDALRHRLGAIAMSLKDVTAVVESTHTVAADHIATAIHAVEDAIQALTPATAGTDVSLQADTLARAQSELASGEFDVQG